MELLQKKIAVPVDENNALDRHFGHCKYFAVFVANTAGVEELEKITPPPHEPGLLPKWLAEQGITDVIAGGLGNKAMTILEKNNIVVTIGAPVKHAKVLVQEYLEGKLVTSENACDH